MKQYGCAVTVTAVTVINFRYFFRNGRYGKSLSIFFYRNRPYGSYCKSLYFFFTVISVTANHFTVTAVTANHFQFFILPGNHNGCYGKSFSKWQDRSTPLMLVDISVPRNVEQETNDLEHVVAYLDAAHVQVPDLFVCT